MNGRIDLHISPPKTINIAVIILATNSLWNRRVVKCIWLSFPLITLRLCFSVNTKNRILWCVLRLPHSQIKHSCILISCKLSHGNLTKQHSYQLKYIKVKFYTKLNAGTVGYHNNTENSVASNVVLSLKTTSSSWSVDHSCVLLIFYSPPETLTPVWGQTSIALA